MMSLTRIPELTFSPLPGSAWQVGVLLVRSLTSRPAFANVALEAMITVNVMAATMFLKFFIVLILLKNIFLINLLSFLPSI
jgi:hypothetical protein